MSIPEVIRPARSGVGSVTYCYQEGCDNQNPPTTANARTGANCASGAVDVPPGTVYNVASGGLEMRWSNACEMNWTRFTPSITSPLVSYDIWVQTQNGSEQSSHYAFPAEAGVQFFSPAY